jgi:hypothetical protein
MLEYFDEFVSAKLISFSDGNYVDGVWVNGVSNIPINIQIIVPQPVTENELQMLTDGETVKDFRKTYCKELLRTREDNKDSDIIEYNGVLYKIYQVDDRNVLGDYYKVIIRKISNSENYDHQMFLNAQATLALTTMTLACPAGNEVRLHWGDNIYSDLVCDGTPKVLTHNYDQPGLYVISVSGDWKKLIRWVAYNQTFLYSDLSAWSEMTDLTILQVYNTGAIGNLASLANLTKLTQLYLASTGIGGSVINLMAMSVLTNLTLYKTEAEGDIASFAPLIKLRTLYLDNSKITGTIASIVSLIELIYLTVYKTDVVYSACVHPLIWRTCGIFAYDCNWSTAMVDQMLIDHAAIAVSGYTNQLRINGNNAAHTNPGIAEDARLSLISKGKTVLVN